MKNKAIKRITAAAVMAAMTLQTAPLAGLELTAHADGEWSKFAVGVTTLGTSVISAPKAPEQDSDAWTGSYVYYGQYENQPVKYRVLDPNTSVFGGTTMLLDCDTVLFTNAFRVDYQAADTNVWAKSDLYKVLNTNNDAFPTTSFTGAEAAAIAESTRVTHELVVGSDAGNVASWTAEAFVNYTPLTGEKIFLLDAEDASNTAYGYSVTDNSTENRKKKKFTDPDSNAYGWWLRSPTYSDVSRAGYVRSDGGDFFTYRVNFGAVGVSPAFNINLSSVVFASQVNDETGTYGKEYKLTLKDSNTAITPGLIARSGDTVTVSYTVTDTNATDNITAHTVSVLILGSDSAIKYYAPLTGTYSASGSGTFTLPDNFDADTDNVYILAEDTHEGNTDKYLTDYVSDMVEVTVPALLHQITISDTTNGTVTADKVTAAEGETVTLTVTPDEGYKVKSVKYNNTVIEPVNGVYSFTMPAEEVTVTAEFAFADGVGARLEGYSLILGDDIGVNFYMELADDVKINTTAKMVFTIPDSGNTSTVELSVSDIVKDETKCVTAENGKTYYIFPCHVAAKEMTSTIKAQIVYTENGDEKAGTEYTYSVKQYADYIIAHPNMYGDKAVSLVKAMLNYGGAAQTLFNHRTDDLASAGVTGLTTFDFPDDLNTCDLTKIKTDGLTLTNISLVLESKTTLRLYFTKTGTTAPDIIETYTDASGNDAERRFTAQTKGNEICYDITGFAPGEIFTSRTLHFADSNVNFAVTIGNYANWAMSGSDDDLKNTILALYNYDEYAKAYKDENYVPGQGGNRQGGN